MKVLLRKIILFGIVFSTSVAAYSQKKLLILGSSTSACYGPSNPANCYVNRLLSHYNTSGPVISIDNRAIGGFNVYKSMPMGFVPPPGRDVPVGYYNISDALAANPDVILVNYPSNGYDIYSVGEVMSCFRIIRDVANKAGKPCYITTTQPRTGFDAAGREKLRILKDSILAQFGSFAVDFWTDLADPATLGIALPYSTGDPVHLNDNGHYVLFQRVVAKNVFAAGPIANAGNDVAVTLPNIGFLDGTKSVASPGSTLTKFSWTYVSGPAQYYIVTPGDIGTFLKYLVAGTYTFRLTVTDDKGRSAFDDVVVTVTSSQPQQVPPPVAAAGADQAITLPVSSVVLDGSKSFSTGSTITNYAWSYVSGPGVFNIVSPASYATTVSGLVQGTYTFRLTVTNASGLSALDEVVITVNPAPAPQASNPPVANAGDDVTFSTSSHGFLNGTKSYAAPGNSLTKFQWTQVSGPSQFYLLTPNDPGTFMKYAAAGIYVFRLTVTDDKGLSASDDVTVTVTDPNTLPVQPPVAQAGPDINITLPTATVYVDASRCSAPGSSITKYQWSIISGPSLPAIGNPFGVSTAISNLVQGVYTVRLTITNASGLSASDDLLIYVQPPVIVQSVLPPVANAGEDLRFATTSFGFLNGTKSAAAPGSILVKYQWTKILGPSYFYLLTPTDVGTFLKNAVPGTYIFRLTVTDNKGLSAYDDVLVTVTDELVLTDPSYLQGPQVNAGADFSIVYPYSGYLNGSKSVPAAGTFFVSCKWTKVSGPTQCNIVSPAEKSSYINGLVPGVYIFRLTIFDNKGLSNSDDVVVNVVTGGSVTGSSVRGLNPVNDGVADESHQSIQLFPNPVIRTINIKWHHRYEGEGVIRIYNARGEIIRKIGINKKLPQLNHWIDIQNLQHGMYFLEIKMKDGNSLTKSFFKN